MKKIPVAFLLVLFSGLYWSSVGVCGKPFEGVITFKITYPDNKNSESQMAMFPKVFTISVKGSRARTDMQSSGMNQVQIIDYTDKTIVSLINMGGQKYAYRKTSADIEKEIGSRPKTTVELTNESKMIAGFSCKKAVVTVTEDGVKSTYEAFFTNELGSKLVNFDNPLYRDIDGVLLEFLYKTKNTKMKFTATSIEKRILPAKDFEIPNDYPLTTEDELKSKYGGTE